jgi:4-amino-4-deoxy-L-arabinose transferase-like glycosyltransferase
MTTKGSKAGRIDRAALLILLIALGLRLAMAAILPTDTLSDDASYYSQIAINLATGKGFTFGPNYKDQFTVGPVYPAFLALYYGPLPEEAAVMGVRVAQAAFDALVVWMVYRIGRRTFGRRAGLIGMGAMALDPRFIYQATDLTTETLFIMLFVAGVALYVRAADTLRMRDFARGGLLLGLATLTRPVPLLLPVALIVHALATRRPRRGRLMRGVALTALVAWATITPWVIRNYAEKGEFIPVSDVGAGNFWLGSQGEGTDRGDEYFESARAEEVEPTPHPRKDTARYSGLAYLMAGLRNVAGDPLGYLAKRAQSTLSACIQPYGTVFFEGASIKRSLGDWLRGEIGLGVLVSMPGFWPKLVVYAFHYGALIFGLAGLVTSGHDWRRALPLALIIVYITGLYSVLIIIPRYLFPTMPFYWTSAGDALARVRVARRTAVERRHAAG